MVKFGMIPEFIGRLPVVSVLEQLCVEDLEAILLNTKNSIIKQYSKLFAIDGVKLTLTGGAIKAIAEKAIELRTGARALRSIMENLTLEIMYEVPDRDDIQEVVINGDVVRGLKKPTYKKTASKSKQDAA